MFFSYLSLYVELGHVSADRPTSSADCYAYLSFEREGKTLHKRKVRVNVDGINKAQVITRVSRLCQGKVNQAFLFKHLSVTTTDQHSSVISVGINDGEPSF